MTSEITLAAEMLSKSNDAIAFTGAGISTESGIPDFRSPGGIWSRYKPVMYQDFLSSEDSRKLYWQMKKEGYHEMRRAKPNDGHIALARLEEEGKIKAVITQNIDGLHQDAGSRKVLELHGTSRHCLCIGCSKRYDPDLIQGRLESGIDVPHCDTCGGFIKSGTVSFGQPLPTDILEESVALGMNCDLFIAIGSSLVVEPAASIPLQAKQNGASLIIMNNAQTPLDPLADALIREPIGKALTQIVNHHFGDRLEWR